MGSRTRLALVLLSVLPAAAIAQPTHPLRLLPAGNATIAPSLLADLDGDGRLDLVQVASSSQSFTIVRGDGFGGFLEPQEFAANHSLATGPVAADVDEDGDLDLVAISNLGFLCRLVATGGGAYAVPNAPLIVEAANPKRVVASDQDGDGHVDLVVIATAGVVVLKGDGAGGFVFHAAFANPSSGPATAAEIADFDGDGDLDAAVRTATTGIAVSAGDGAGGFLPPSAIATAISVTDIASGDGDLDGDLDLLVATSLNGGSGGVQSIANLGGLSFGPAAFVAAFPSAAYGVALADLDGSGYPELIALPSGEVRVQQDAFAPVPGAVRSRPIALVQRTILAGRLDGDDAIDLVLADCDNARHATIVRGAAPDLLESQEPVVAPSSFLAALDDVDHDGDEDAIAVENAAGVVRTWINDGNGGFAAAAGFSIGQPVFGVIGAADLDADGDVDLVVSTAAAIFGPSQLVVLRAQAGGYAADPAVPFAAIPRAIAFGRFNADPGVDFVVGDFDATSNSGFYVFASGPSGYAATLVAQPGIDVSGVINVPSSALATLDVDHDGFDDVVAHATQPGRLLAFHCDGAGGFALAQTIPIPAAAGTTTGIVAADVDGDGWRDVAVGPRLLVFKGLAGSLQTTAPPVATDLVYLFGRLSAFDVDEDGKDDVVQTGFAGTPTLGWRRSVGDLTFEPARFLAASAPPSAALAGDVDGDARPDFVVSSGGFVPSSLPGAIYVAAAGCEGEVGRYAEGCALPQGNVARLAVDGCAEPGSHVALRVDGAQGAGMALVVFGTAATSIPLPNGCVLAVSPLLPSTLLLPLGAGGSVAVDAVLRPFLADQTLTMQAFLPAGAATNAIEMRVGK